MNNVQRSTLLNHVSINGYKQQTLISQDRQATELYVNHRQSQSPQVEFARGASRHACRVIHCSFWFSPWPRPWNVWSVSSAASHSPASTRQTETNGLFSIRLVQWGGLGEGEFPFLKEAKLGANDKKCVAAGVHLPTPWLFVPAKRPDDRADYCLGTRR